MKKFILLIILLQCILNTFSQTDYDKYKENRKSDEKNYKQTQKEGFNTYKKERQQEIANLLKTQWEEKEVLAGRKRPERPSLPELPKADTNETIKENRLNVEIISQPKSEAIVIKRPEDTPEKPKIDSIIFPKNQTAVNFKFYDYNVNEYYNQEFIKKLSGISEKAIGTFWEQMKNTDYYNLIDKYLQTKESLRLNDWAYFLYIQELSKNIFPIGYENERNVFTAFILNCSGYNVRLAMDISKTKIYLMLSVINDIFEIPYWKMDNRKYIIFNKSDNSSIFTCAKLNSLSSDEKNFNMYISEPIFQKQSNTIIGRKNLESSIFYDESETITFNANLKNFYDKYPACNFEVYFNSLPSKEVILSLDKLFNPLLAGKTDLEKVEMFLKFIHESFEYKTDEEQFGREKYFFVEEMFMYKYNDCEDRAIFFSYLVKRFTKLKVVGVIYYDHAAIAVKFNENIKGTYYMYNGDKYYVCDPTYIGAKIGQAMPQYNNQSVEIIEVY